jgi:hypothetical protein
MGKGSTLKIDIVADGSKASRTLDTVSGKVGRFGKGLAIGAAAGAAGVALAAGKIAVDSVKSASAVEQAYGGLESVFGKYAGSAKKAAEGAATSVGLAKSEYADLATVLGAQLKNMGTSADQLAPKTDQLIKQGADLAATFGGTTADAVSAVSSLLKGERDPIERYGVSIKAADVSARLAAQGMDKLKGPALAAAQAQATLALLTEQTTSAQGAFGRESDTAAGQQQRLTAQWENAKAGLGQGLLPIITRVATFLTTKVMPAVQGAAGTLAKNLGPAISRVSSFITGTLVPAARLFLTWFKDKIAPGIRSAVTPIIDGLRRAFASVQAAVQRNKPQLETIGRVLKSFAEFVATKVAPVVGKVLGGAFQVAGKLIGGAIDTIGGIVTAIQSAIEWIRRLKDAASNIGGGILSKLPGFGFASMTTTTTAPTTAPTLMASPSTLVSSPQTLLAAAGPSTSGLAAAIAQGGRAVNNYLTIRVDGALDPIAVAEQLTGILRDHAARTGRPLVMA